MDNRPSWEKDIEDMSLDELAQYMRGGLLMAMGNSTMNTWVAHWASYILQLHYKLDQEKNRGKKRSR
jgi:hypothetical protein